MRRDQPWSDHRAVHGPRTRVDRQRENDSRELDFELDAAVLHEVPVVGVLVVVDRVHRRHHEPTTATHLDAAVRVGVLPEDPGVLLVNADGVVDVVGAAEFEGETNVWMGNGVVDTSIGTYKSGSYYSVGTGPRAVTAGDFNGDGKSDILWRQATTGVITIWLMNGGAVQSYAGGWTVPTDWVIQ